MQLRIATCRPLPEPDPDEELLLAALRARGVAARMAAWNDPAEDWDAPGATLIRSTWDYIHALDAFVAWLDRAARSGPVWNPAEVVRANVHKRYLVELARRGVPTTPTWLVAHTDSRGIAGAARPADAIGQVELERELDRRGFGDIVIKPAIGAASFRTRRFARSELAAAVEHLNGLLADRDALVQPYLASVDGYGERALVWIDGEFTHAVRKTPRWSGEDEAVSSALDVEPEERALGEIALAPLARHLLYARVDVARDERGQPLVMELELVEPSLFLAQNPLALARLADAIARRSATR
ncbi:MAG: hypothetical protein IT453_22060 [Planctomycetes bacterium]|nr:hypothetical protein [Planctomycetota bacterium]